MTSSLLDRLFEPISIVRLVYFRVVIGFFMAYQALEIAISPDDVPRHFTDSQILFKYQGFEWVAALSPMGFQVLLWGMVVVGIGVMLGALYRVCATAFFLGWGYLFFCDQTFYQNHYYLLFLLSFLMIFVPAHRWKSIDARWRPGIVSEWVPRWTLLVIQTQLAIVYIGGGIAKISGDWLQGQPMGMWLAEPGRAEKIPFLSAVAQDQWVVYLFTYSGLLLDLLVVPALLWGRTRWLAFASISLFHLMNSVLWIIGIFPWFMLLATPILLPPRYFRFGSARRAMSAAESDSVRSSATVRKVVLGGLAVYMTIQLVMPFRHLLHPGPSTWTEQGSRFAWHMKLRSKGGPPQSGSVVPRLPVFHALSRSQNKVMTFNQSQLLLLFMKPELRISGKNSELSPEDLDMKSQRVTRAVKRAAYMAIHPDMILQVAHFIRDDLSREAPDIEVYVLESPTILNGRRPQNLIDPTVDLARIAIGTPHHEYTLPLTVELSDRFDPGAPDGN